MLLESKFVVALHVRELISLHYAAGVCLQKKIRKDPEPMKSFAAATVIGGRRPPAAAARAPICTWKRLQSNHYI